MTKIVIDTKGSDRGVDIFIKGASDALGKFENLSLILVGDKEVLEEGCATHCVPLDRGEIIDARGEITNYDNAAQALYTKGDSSMLTALSLLGEREDVAGGISAGNTAVLLTGAMRYLPKKERVRPALAALLPSQNGSFTCVVDTGATIDCTPSMLVHFARLGTSLMSDMYGITEPKVGLLSNGAEASKGNKLVVETHAMLSEDVSLNFIGNIEGNRALSGDCDVLVCDGFSGNQVLKVTEGTAVRIITDILKYAHRKDSAEIKELASHLMGVYDIGSLGGGIILGVSKPVIKIRGNATEKAIVNVCEMILNIAENRAAFDKTRNKI